MAGLTLADPCTNTSCPRSDTLSSSTYCHPVLTRTSVKVSKEVIQAKGDERTAPILRHVTPRIFNLTPAEPRCSTTSEVYPEYTLTSYIQSLRRNVRQASRHHARPVWFRKTTSAGKMHRSASANHLVAARLAIRLPQYRPRAAVAVTAARAALSDSRVKRESTAFRSTPRGIYHNLRSGGICRVTGLCQLMC